MAMGSTQHLAEMSNRNISWGKDGRCVGLTNLHPLLRNLGDSNSWKPQGFSSSVMEMLYFFMFLKVVKSMMN
jgi:hypothetical protein